jgi:hypothetical protein
MSSVELSAHPPLVEPAQVHTVFSSEKKPYQNWQAQLLYYSYLRARQPGPLTRLVSGGDDGVPEAPNIFYAPAWNPHPVTGDDYAPYNKPASLATWLRQAPPEEEVILLVDPDFVFLAPLARYVERGHPVGQPKSYLVDSDGLITRRHCRRPDRVQPVGVPLLIHRDDLAALAPDWLVRTEAIRGDTQAREQAGWVAEMWAYSFVAAELGLDHEVVELAALNTEDRDDLPLVHYCYSTSDGRQKWTWDKRDYEPWEPVVHPSTIPRASVRVFDLINEMAALRSRVCVLGLPE